MILLLYFFLFIFALLYSLVIGRASVISSAPLAILSLLPSILISIAAWVMKSTLLNNDNERNEDKNDNGKYEIDGKSRCNSKQLKETDANKDGLKEESHSSEEKEGESNQCKMEAMLY